MESQLVFLAQIDRVSKEKGIQIIEHFIHNTDLERYQKMILNSEKESSDGFNQNFQLTSE